MAKGKNERGLAGQRSQSGGAHAARQSTEAEPACAAHPRQEGRTCAGGSWSFRASGSAVDVKKTLESAIANAENNHSLDVDDLVVAEAHVGKALVMKRFQPRARGRAGRIEKPFSNLTIVVREVAAAAKA